MGCHGHGDLGTVLGSHNALCFIDKNRSSEAPWVRRIGNLSSRENLVMTSPNGLRPYRLLGRGIYINLYLARLKSVNIPITYFVSHFHLPSPEGKVFGKHTKKKINKKPFGYILITAIFRVFSIALIGVISGFNTQTRLKGHFPLY